jgi:hypothetical protein
MIGGNAESVGQLRSKSTPKTAACTTFAFGCNSTEQLCSGCAGIGAEYADELRFPPDGRALITEQAGS